MTSRGNGRRPALSDRDSISTASSGQSYAAMPAPSFTGTDGFPNSPVSTSSTRAGSLPTSPVLPPVQPFGSSQSPQGRPVIPPLRPYRTSTQSPASSGSWTPQAPFGIAPSHFSPGRPVIPPLRPYQTPTQSPAPSGSWTPQAPSGNAPSQVFKGRPIVPPLRPYRNPIRRPAPSGSWTPQAPAGIASYPFPPQFQPQMPVQQPPQGIMSYPFGPPTGQYPPPMGITPWAPPQYPQMWYPPPYGQPFPPHPPHPPSPPPPAQERPAQKRPATPPHVKLLRNLEISRVVTAGMPFGSVDSPVNTPRLVREGDSLRIVEPIWTQEDADRFKLGPPPDIPERVENEMAMRPNQTHYETVGVHPLASQEALNAIVWAKLEALQEMMAKPTTQPIKKKLARTMYTNITRAFDVLTDPVQRQRYDQDIGIAPGPPDQNHDSDERYRQAHQTATAHPEILLPSDKRSWTLESEPWQVLEVPADATEEEIAEAYNAFHDKFLSTRCDLSDVELKAAEVLLAKKRQAPDFLLDLHSDEEDDPEGQYADREPETNGPARHPQSSTAGHHDQSPGHRGAPWEFQNRGYRNTNGVEEDSDSDYSDLPSQRGSAGHLQARQPHEPYTSRSQDPGARPSPTPESDGNRNNDYSQSHLQRGSAQTQSQTTHTKFTRPVFVPSPPPNSPAPSGTHRNDAGPSLRKRVVTRQHRDQGGRTDEDQALEWQIRTGATGLINDDDEFPSERHEDRVFESDPQERVGARSDDRGATHAQSTRPPVPRTSPSRQW